MYLVYLIIPYQALVDLGKILQEYQRQVLITRLNGSLYFYDYSSR